MQKKEVATFYPTSAQAWRDWLAEHHHSEQSVWLVCYKKKSNVPTISWSDAVDEALCFGWIDSTRKTVNEEQFIQFFSKRKPKSVWSKINKEKVLRLMGEGLIMEAGYTSIETAKQNGSWTLLDDAEELNIPEDLETALTLQPGAKDFFLGLSKSARKSILQWLVLARRPETRERRITEIAMLAAQQLKPVPFR